MDYELKPVPDSSLRVISWLDLVGFRLLIFFLAGWSNSCIAKDSSSRTCHFQAKNQWGWRRGGFWRGSCRCHSKNPGQEKRGNKTHQKDKNSGQKKTAYNRLNIGHKVYNFDFINSNVNFLAGLGLGRGSDIESDSDFETGSKHETASEEEETAPPPKRSILKRPRTAMARVREKVQIEWKQLCALTISFLDKRCSPSYQRGIGSYVQESEVTGHGRIPKRHQNLCVILGRFCWDHDVPNWVFKRWNDRSWRRTWQVGQKDPGAIRENAGK